MLHFSTNSQRRGSRQSSQQRSQAAEARRVKFHDAENKTVRRQ